MSVISRTAYKRLVRDRVRLRQIYGEASRVEQRVTDRLLALTSGRTHFGASSLHDFVLDWSCNAPEFSTPRLLKRLGIRVEKRQRKAGAR
jgi:hypothetical protein